MRAHRLVPLAVAAVLLCSGASQQKPIAKSVDALWLDAQRTATTTSGGRKREDVAVYERFLAAHKDYVPAMLAIAYHYQDAAEEITDRSAKSIATRTRQLETAAAHYLRASEVATEPLGTISALVGLLRVLGASNLNRIADAAPAARAAVKKYPDNSGVVFAMVQAMLPTPESALDPATLRGVRGLVPSTPGAQYALAMQLFNLERHAGKGTVPRESAQKLMAESVAAIDAALKIRPNDYESLMFKVMVLEAQAERIEQDPARKKALAAEAARLTALAQSSREPSWQDAVRQAVDLYAQGKIPDAIAALRTVRATLPPMHQLQLAQYLTEHVMSSPKMARPEAQKLLDEARAIADELVKRKQEVRMALMLKSMVLKVQADQVEQNPQRQRALRAESDRAYEDSRSVNADGSPVVKTLDDLWNDAQRRAFTTSPDGKDREDVTVYEKFLAAHRDHVPALTAIARYYYTAANEITDKSAKSLATRTKYLETASSHYRRASEVATKEEDAALAVAGLIDTLGPEFLNRPAEAATLARAAVKKYPNQSMLVMQLMASLLPTPAAADAAALRSARDLVPNNAQAWQVFGMYLWSLDNRHRATQSRESTRMLLADAASALDAAIKLKPDFVEAVIYKSLVLRTQAERVEQDPARRKALLAEADRLRALGEKLLKR